MCKKFFIGLLAAFTVLVAAIGFTACGEVETKVPIKPTLPSNPVEGTEGLSYMLSDKGTYYVASGMGSCTDTEIVIGNVHNNLPVTGIRDYAFSGYSSLTSITISDGVANIGFGAFEDCRGLTSISLPDSIVNIEGGAFYNCSSLSSIIFGGTTAQWEAIEKGNNWDYNTGEYTVQCTGKMGREKLP